MSGQGEGQAAGWHPDPQGRFALRWWDGTAWTEQVSDGTTPSVDPLVPASSPAAATTAGGGGGGGKSPIGLIVGVLAVLAIGVVGFLVLGGGDDAPPVLDQDAAEERIDAAYEAAADEGEQNDADVDNDAETATEELDGWLNCIEDEAGVGIPDEVADPEPIVFGTESDVRLAIVAYDSATAAVVGAAIEDAVVECFNADLSGDSGGNFELQIDTGEVPEGDAARSIVLSIESDFGDIGLDMVLVASGQFVVYGRASTGDFSDERIDTVELRDDAVAAAVTTLEG